MSDIDSTSTSISQLLVVTCRKISWIVAEDYLENEVETRYNRVHNFDYSRIRNNQIDLTEAIDFKWEEMNDISISIGDNHLLLSGRCSNSSVTNVIYGMGNNFYNQLRQEVIQRDVDNIISEVKNFKAEALQQLRSVADENDSETINEKFEVEYKRTEIENPVPVLKGFKRYKDLIQLSPGECYTK